MAKPMTGSNLFLKKNLCPVQCLIPALFYGESRTTESWKFHLNTCPDTGGFMYLLKESGFVEGRKHSQAFVEPHNKW